MTTVYRRRNPIRWHGRRATDHYTSIPNDLARDEQLLNYPRAYALAVVIRSHKEGFEVSAQSLSEMTGWSRNTVSKALGQLVECRWLAKTTYLNADGNRAFDEYHLHATRQFTESEHREWNRDVSLNYGPLKDQLAELADEYALVGAAPEPDWNFLTAKRSDDEPPF